MGVTIMQIVNQKIVLNKKVLLRLDLDVAISNGKILEDYKIRAGLPTLKLCIQNASKVVILGHIGRPEGKVVEDLKVAPIVEWFKSQGLSSHLESGRLVVMENLRFDPREESCDFEYAKELAQMGDVYINEAFSSYRPAVSTTVLPTLFPHVKDPEGHLWPRRAAGLRFAEEVRVLREVRNPPAGGPKKPFIAIMGGAKVKDKLPVIEVLAQKADAVLVGGKLVSEIMEQQLSLPKNVMVGKLNEDGFDIAEETVSAWVNLINRAAMIIWNGPLGKFEDPKNTATQKIAQMVLGSKAEVIIGGGDSVAALNQYGLMEKAQQKAFVSVGGGAMLKLLSDGTLPTIEALK